MYQKRASTYGKRPLKGAVSKSFADGFDRFHAEDEVKGSPSKLRKLENVSTAKSSSPVTLSTADPFDVPTSGDDDIPSPVKTTKIKQSRTSRSTQAYNPSNKAPGKVLNARFPTRSKDAFDRESPRKAPAKQVEHPAMPVNNDQRKRKREVNIGRDEVRVKSLSRQHADEPLADDQTRFEKSHSPPVVSPAQNCSPSHRADTAMPDANLQATPHTMLGRSSERQLASVASPVRPGPRESVDRKLTQMSPGSRPSTPPLGHKISENYDSPPSSLTRTAQGTTPKQAKMWKGLLGDADDLLLKESQGKAAPSQRKRELSEHATTQDQPALETRPRVVDRLGKSIHDVSSSESGEESSPSRPSSKASTKHPEMDLDHGFEISRQTSSSRILTDTGGPLVPADNSHPNSTFARHAAQPLITYSSQRSYLDESAIETNGALGTPGLGASRRIPEKVSTLEANQDPVNNTSMRSLQELRASGGNTRYQDDINNLKMEIETGEGAQISRRRSALVDLARRCNSAAFVSRFLQDEHHLDVFQACRLDPDPVSGLALSVILHVLLVNTDDMPRIAEFEDLGLFESLSNWVTHTRSIESIVRDRRLNMSKIAQEQIKGFANESLARTGLSAAVRPSPMTFAIKTCDLLVRKLRKSGNSSVLMTDALLDGAIEAIDSPEHTLKMAALSMLESASVAPTCSGDASLWTDARLGRLSSHVSRLLTSTSTERLTQALICRVILNLSHGSERKAHAFSSPELLSTMINLVNTGFEAIRLNKIQDVMGETNEASTSALDALVLTLGCLTNLAEVDTTALQVVSTQVQRSAVELLLKQFIEGQKKSTEADSLEQSHANVAHGYLVVLLAVMCRDFDLRKQIKRQLPGSSLAVLVKALEEFIQHHKTADIREEQNNDIWVEFTNRLQVILSMLRSCQ